MTVKVYADGLKARYRSARTFAQTSIFILYIVYNHVEPIRVS